MQITQLCKVCLAVDVQLFTINNTQLQDTYEKLTNLPFNQNDGRVETVCYQCVARLRNCWRFRQTAIQAAQVLAQLLTEESMIEENAIKQIQRDVASCTLSVNILNSVDITAGGEYVKSEQQKFKGELAKEEDAGSDAPHHSDIDKSEPLDRSDSDDDLPLKIISAIKDDLATRRQSVRKRKNKTKAKLEAAEVTLTAEQQRLELAERARSLNYLNSPYKCGLCYKGFVHEQAYRNHALRHSEASGPLECGVCRLRYRDARQLRAHAAAAHERRYVCARCPHRAHTRSQAAEHERWHDGHTYPCRLCGETFSKPTSYLTHARKAHASEHVCARCGHSFVGRHGLLMHASKAHRDPDPDPDPVSEPAAARRCDACDIQFATRAAWTRHALTAARHAPYGDDGECRACGVRVPAELRREHVRAHLRPPRQPRPPADTPRAAPLAALPCDQCELRFASRARLRAHARRVHLGVKYDKNVICEVCGKKYTSEAALRYHQRRHTGVRPHRCVTCGSRFADSNQLRIHARRHSGERPYACAACPKRFTQKPALNRHYRVHTGAKPYECQLCSKTFSQSNSVKLHVNTVHLKIAPRRKRAGSKLVAPQPAPAEPPAPQPA